MTSTRAQQHLLTSLPRNSKAGAECNGKPGYRPQYAPGIYAAYILDPDGHNIECTYYQCFPLTLLQQLPLFAGFLLGAFAYHSMNRASRHKQLSPLVYTLGWGVSFIGTLAAARHWNPYGGVVGALMWVGFLLVPVAVLLEAWVLPPWGSFFFA